MHLHGSDWKCGWSSVGQEQGFPDRKKSPIDAFQMHLFWQNLCQTHFRDSENAFQTHFWRVVFCNYACKNMHSKCSFSDKRSLNAISATNACQMHFFPTGSLPNVVCAILKTHFHNSENAFLQVWKRIFASLKTHLKHLFILFVHKTFAHSDSGKKVLKTGRAKCRGQLKPISQPWGDYLPTTGWSNSVYWAEKHPLIINQPSFVSSISMYMMSKRAKHIIDEGQQWLTTHITTYHN